MLYAVEDAFVTYAPVMRASSSMYMVRGVEVLMVWLTSILKVKVPVLEVVVDCLEGVVVATISETVFPPAIVLFAL